MITNNNPDIANAGTDQSTCNDYYTISALEPNIGTGQWSNVSGAGVIDSPSTFTTLVSGLSQGGNTFRWTVSNGGCEDADDAFSIYEEDNKLFLAIHIADPTEYINIDSSLWKNIEERVVTRYPSNKKPIHMIPNEIMEKSSLMVNKHGSLKMIILMSFF